MAKRVVTHLVSDLSGDVIEDGSGETIEFAYRGTTYTIDLTEKEAAAFDKAVARYVENGSRTRAAARQPRTSRGRGEYDPKDVRAWAQANGISVPERGRIPKTVLEQYQAAN